MSTEAIIILAIAAIVLIALFIAVTRSSKMREKKRIKQEREQAKAHHREAAQAVGHEASQAELEAQQARERARKAEEDAEIARERALMHEERAEMHEKGLADHELPSTSGAQADGYANEAAYADTARGDTRDPRDERSGVIGDEHDETPGADRSGRFAREDEGVTRTDVESGTSRRA